MNFYVLDTKEQSDKCLKACLNAILRVHKGNAYQANTTSWAIEQTRLDGKYIVPVCKEYEAEIEDMSDSFEDGEARAIYGFLIETSTTEWFPESEL